MKALKNSDRRWAMSSTRRLKIYFGVVIAVMILFSNAAMAQTISYEKGDLLFSGTNLSFGHTSIYEKWDGLHDPSVTNSHFIIESLANGPQRSSLSRIWSVYKRSGTKNPTYAQRNLIICYAEGQFDKPYCFNPAPPASFKGPTCYRCDGLAEAAYESVGHDIVPAAIDHALTTWPFKQATYMEHSSGVGPDVEMTSITCPSDPYPTDQYYKGTITVTAHANDGTHGSGTKLVQFWYGVPPTDWSSSPNIDKDLHDAYREDDYTCEWDTTTIDDGQYTLYAKAYDQAGNSKVSSGETITVDNTPPTIESTTPSDSSKCVSRNTNIVITFSEKMDKSSAESAFSMSPSVSGSKTWSNEDKTLTFNPSSDLEKKTTYTVTIGTGAKDLAGNHLDGNGDGTEGPSYSWSFKTLECVTDDDCPEDLWCEECECVPEASTLVLFATGSLFLTGYVRLKRRKRI